MGKVGWIVVGLIVVFGVVGCIVAATADSCERLNRPCFGNSTDK